MAFMVETCWPRRPTALAPKTAHTPETAQPDQAAAWADFPKAKIK